MNHYSDKYLIKGLKKDDAHSFRKIYDKYHKPVYGIALKYLKSDSLAEDAVHDVFIKLWDYRHKLDAQQSLKGFLLTSTKNHVLNIIRDRNRDEEKNRQYSRLKSKPHNKTVSKLTFENYKKVFEHFLKKLPEGKRKIFKMKMNEGVSNKEIADRLDISVNTVKSQYYKASKFIKEQLSEHTDLELK